MQEQQETIPFHHLEDIPPDDLQTALELYYQSRSSLQNPRKEADVIMGDIVQRTTQVKAELDELIRHVDAQKAPELIIAFQEIVENTRHNYQDTARMARIIEQLGAIDSNAIGIIDAQRESIDQLTNEMEGLLQKIKDGDTLDDRFAPLLDVARRMMEEDTRLVALVSAEFDMIDKISHYIRHLTNANGRLAYSLASRLFYMMQGLLDKDTPGLPTTEAERAAFIQLLEALVITE